MPTLADLEAKLEEQKTKRGETPNPFDGNSFGWCGVAQGSEPGVPGGIGYDDIAERSGLEQSDHSHTYLALTDTDNTFSGFDKNFPKVDGSSLKFSKILDSDLPSLLTKKTYRSNKQEGLTLKAYGAATGETGELRFRELSANGESYVGFKSPDSIAANSIWTLPSADGTANQVVKTDGSKVLGFANVQDLIGTYSAKKLVVNNEAGDAWTNATNAEWDETNDRLEVISANAHCIRSTRSTSETNIRRSAMQLVHRTSGSMADNFGVTLNFGIQEGAGTINVIGGLTMVRDGADNSGRMDFIVDRAGTAAGRMCLTKDSNLLIGIDQNTEAASAVKSIQLFTGTAPTGSVADAFSMYAADVGAAATACPKFRTEDGKVLILYEQAHVADASTSHATASFADVNTALDALAGIINTILSYRENQGFNATS